MKRTLKRGHLEHATWIRVYDNGGKTADRYTAVLDSKDWNASVNPKYRACIGMSGAPTHPQGVSMFGECQEGRHLGRELAWESVPEHIRQHILWRIRPGQ